MHLWLCKSRIFFIVFQAAEVQVVLQSLQHDLQEEKEKKSDLVKAHEQKESDLRGNVTELFVCINISQNDLFNVVTAVILQMLRLSQELQCVQDEKEALLVTVHSTSEEVEKLFATVAALTAERDQLKLDLQENVEMVS